MEMIENPATKSTNSTNQSNWLRTTISDAEEKMKAILNLWEENHSVLINDEIHERRKAAVTKEVQDLFISYCSLVEKYDRLKFVTTNTLSSGSSSSLSNNVRSHVHGLKYTEFSGSWDDSELEAIDSNTESTNNSIHKDDGKIKQENAWYDDVEKFRISKLVEDNTRLQVELIRRNNEKRETIKKLQNQVNKLIAENDAIQRRLSHYERIRQDVGVISPKRKSILLDKFFKGCS